MVQELGTMGSKSRVKSAVRAGLESDHWVGGVIFSRSEFERVLDVREERIMIPGSRSSVASWGRCLWRVVVR